MKYEAKGNPLGIKDHHGNNRIRSDYTASPSDNPIENKAAIEVINRYDSKESLFYCDLPQYCSRNTLKKTVFFAKKHVKSLAYF